MRKVKSQKSKVKSELPDYRVEIKNINSFKFARRAIEYEIERQTEILERGEVPIQQTRGWNEAKGVTFSQRDKEEAHDYRYFPEPDIPPIRWDQFTINNLQLTIPELPDAKKERFMSQYALSDYDAVILTDTKETADYFEECVKTSVEQGVPVKLKTIANMIINKKVDIQIISPLDLVSQLAAMLQQNSMSSDDLDILIPKIISANQKAIDDYKKGKEQALMFLVGQVMKEAKGKCSAEDVKVRMLGILIIKNS